MVKADLAGFVPPEWAGREVTRDERFTGGHLAGRSIVDLRGAIEAG